MATPPFKALVFTKTTGYLHTSIHSGISMFQNLASRTSPPAFTVPASDDASLFTPSTLSNFSVIVLLQTVGEDIFSAAQLAAFKNFVRRGGGVVAIHGAVVVMSQDEWYTNLLGASFDMHPPAELGTVVAEVASQKHYIVSGCGGRDNWMDEWYNFRTHPRDNANLRILLKGDVSSFKGGKHGDDHPLAWCQEFEGGRVFFTALGHFEEAYEDGWFAGQVERGLLWAARREE